MGRAHFEPPADGFIVVVVAPLGARCGGGCDSSSLESAASESASVLTSTDDAGALTWLDLPTDEGLSPRRVHIVLIHTPEVGDDFTAMASSCRAQPNFPLALLDFIEPRAPLFSQTASRVSASGGRAHALDFCALLSSGGMAQMRAVAAGIAAE